jgi:DNA-binding response OmpR family regulator
MTRLLLVEDDAAVAEALSLALRGLGHDVTVADSGERAIATLFGGGPSVEAVLLDVMLPGIDGFEVCRQVRARSMVPVVLLTARGDPVDVVVGLEVGADDYVVKPVEPRVVDARVKAILRRVTTPPEPSDPTMRIGHLVVDPLAMTAAWDGADVPLTATEVRLLVEFARHPGQVLSRQTLLRRVWDYHDISDSRIVDAAVARLRGKVEQDPKNPALLRTVRGMGYRLVVP